MQIGAEVKERTAIEAEMNRFKQQLAAVVGLPNGEGAAAAAPPSSIVSQGGLTLASINGDSSATSTPETQQGGGAATSVLDIFGGDESDFDFLSLA